MKIYEFWYDSLEESYKISRDLKAIVDTAFNDGKLEGLKESKKEGELKVKLEVAKALKLNGFSIDTILKKNRII